MNNDLAHYGIMGMKWGVRRYQNPDGTRTNAGKRRYYGPTSVRAAIAKRSNKKVDKSFKKWEEGSKRKAEAIDLGKKANVKKIESINNKAAKPEYKQSNKEYKKALRKNTTYRKGAVKQEVGRDRARKLLSEGKKIQKQIEANPSDLALKAKYNKIMNEYSIERHKARRAADVGKTRSRFKASLKRKRTVAVKAVATTAAITAGTLAVNMYLQKKGNAYITNNLTRKVVDAGKSVMKYAKYIYG